MAAMAAEGDGKGTVVVVGAGIAGLSAALAILQSVGERRAHYCRAICDALEVRAERRPLPKSTCLNAAEPLRVL